MTTKPTAAGIAATLDADVVPSLRAIAEMLGARFGAVDAALARLEARAVDAADQNAAERAAVLGWIVERLPGWLVAQEATARAATMEQAYELDLGLCGYARLYGVTRDERYRDAYRRLIAALEAGYPFEGADAGAVHRPKAMLHVAEALEAGIGDGIAFARRVLDEVRAQPSGYSSGGQAWTWDTWARWQAHQPITSDGLTGGIWRGQSTQLAIVAHACGPADLASDVEASFRAWLADLPRQSDGALLWSPPDAFHAREVRWAWHAMRDLLRAMRRTFLARLLRGWDADGWPVLATRLDGSSVAGDGPCIMHEGWALLACALGPDDHRLEGERLEVLRVVRAVWRRVVDGPRSGALYTTAVGPTSTPGTRELALAGALVMALEDT